MPNAGYGIAREKVVHAMSGRSRHVMDIAPVEVRHVDSVADTGATVRRLLAAWKRQGANEGVARQTRGDGGRTKDLLRQGA